MSGGFYRGTSIEQDGRFANKERKLIRSREWPKEFESRVDIRKVNLEAFRPWVDKKLEDIMGVEDELVSGLCISELENSDEKGPDPRKLQINLTGFLSDRAGEFMLELWKLLLEAQDKESGIPDALVDQNKTEIDQKMTETQLELQKVQDMMNAIHQERNQNLDQVASHNEQILNNTNQASLDTESKAPEPEDGGRSQKNDENEIDIDQELLRRERRKKKKKKKRRRYRSRSSEKDRRRSRSEKRSKRRKKKSKRKSRKKRYDDYSEEQRSDVSERKRRRSSKKRSRHSGSQEKERVRVRGSSSSSLSF